ncbi:MAG: N-acetyltransferase [Akkermansiaceae bacterium]|jgi:putative acetyltransferase|nr:N-acetyltransferase [Akkermansiaceae bacterium]
MKIRTTTREDADAVRELYLSAFAADERDLVAQLAVELILEETAAAVLSLVAEDDGIVVGHVAFSPVTTSGTRQHLGHILAPLAVHPDHQQQGIGSQLVKSGIGRLSEHGPGILLVYGDPKFYGRFGFRVDAARWFTPPFELRYPFGWQGIALRGQHARTSTVKISCVEPLSHPALW